MGSFESRSEFLFLVDVDGVVTDEHARIDMEVVDLLVGLEGRGAGVAFITGRSREWLNRQLLPALRREGVEGANSFVLAAEMGAVRLVDGAWVISEEHAVSEEVRSSLRGLADRPGYSGLVEWDGTKEATATFEAVHAPESPGHAERARTALADLFMEVEPLARQHGYRAALSTYALDVLAPSLSKAVGASFAVAALTSRRSRKRVVVLGDSAGDLAMATTARALIGAVVEFFWVGRGPAPAADGIDVRVAPLQHAAGTKLLLSGL